MRSVITGVHKSAVTLRMLVKMLAWIRFVQILPWPVAFAAGVRFDPPHLWLALLGYGLQAGWTLVYGGRALRTGTLPDWLMALDIGVTCSCLVASGLGWSTASGSVLAGMAIYPAVGVALATGVVWWRGRAIAAAILIAACYVIGTLPEIHPGAPVIVTVTGTVLSLLGFTAMAGLITKRLLGQAEMIAATSAAMISAREHAAAQHARHDERMTQYRLLHDTVLSTLNTIARGDVLLSAQLRQRCAAEADALRSMISGDGRPAAPLIAELALVVRHQAALGLRVHSNIGELTRALPPEAIAALIGSCREALNNVAKHAGTDEAWLTACADQDGSILISVVDRGRGFDPEFMTSGLGMSESIVARMAEAGGTSTVDSGSGQGTCVELRWPR
jgi:signal transduction histidine kinase